MNETYETKLKGNEMIKCPTCNGTGKQILRCVDYQTKVEELTEITCVACNGDGEITDEQLAEIEWYKNMWCKCDSVLGSDFYDNDECDCGVSKHHYHCLNCGKVTQIG